MTPRRSKKAAASSARGRAAALPDLLAQALFDQSPFSNVIYDAAGHVLALNAAFTRLWGARFEDVPTGYSVLDDPQLAAQGVIPLIRRAFAGEVVTIPAVRYDMAAISARGEGRTVWTQGHFHPLMDASGRVTHVVLTHIDITERVTAEEELRRVVERLSALQRATAELTAALTPREVADVVVRAGVPALGAARGSLAVFDADANTLELIGAVGYATAAIERFRRTPLDASFPLTDAVREGKPIFLATGAARAERYPHLADLRAENGGGAMAAIPLRGTRGIIGVLGINWGAEREFTPDDVAFLDALAQQCAQALERARLYEEERHARTAARAAAERLQTIADAARALTDRSLDAQAAVEALADVLANRLGDQCTVRMLSPDGEWLDPAAVRHPDPETRRLLESLSATERYHVDDDGITGQVFRSGESAFIPETDPEQIRQSFKRAYRPWTDRLGMHSIICVPLRTREGTLGTVFVSRDTQPAAYTTDDLALVTDLADRAALVVERARLYERERTARRDAEQANRAKSDFLAAMSHELRTPLNGIGGYVELLDMELRGPITSEQRDDLARIRRNQQHLLTLIEDVLSFARVEAGRLVVEEARVPVADALRFLEPLVLPQLEAKGLRYTMHGCDSGLTVLGDHDRIVQVCVNLLTNAIKATPNGGAIAVSCDSDAAHVRIHVADTGPGIPADKREAIFSPFTQLGRSLNNPRAGAGLGLSISRGLAAAMGGALTVESEEGKGSTFTLTLRKAP